MFRASFSFLLKLAQIALGFGLNQISFNVLDGPTYVLATRALAVQDNLAAFWAPFMVRWQHGESEVSYRFLVQMVGVFTVISSVAGWLLLRGQAAWTAATLGAVAVAIYAAYKKMFQIAYAHLITKERVNNAVSLNIGFNSGEASVLLILLVVGATPLSLLSRYGAIGFLLLIAVVLLLQAHGLRIQRSSIKVSVREVFKENLANGSLLVHNLLLSGYFSGLKVVVPGRAEIGTDEAVFLFFVSMSQMTSGVFYSFTEFIRPDMFRWARGEAPFPAKRAVGLGLFFAAATVGYATAGFPLIQHLSPSNTAIGSHYSLWIWSALGALLLGLAYLLDVALVATKRYSVLAIGSAVSMFALILTVAIFPRHPGWHVVVFPAVQCVVMALFVIPLAYRGSES